MRITTILIPRKNIIRILLLPEPMTDRLQTLDNVRRAGISVCSGGIIGLGETHEDRIGMLFTLCNLPKHPESVPINALVRVKGTPLQDNEKS